jgi:hypothetical protein
MTLTGDEIARAVWSDEINHPTTDGKITPAELLRRLYIKMERSEEKIDRLIAAGTTRDAVLVQLVTALAEHDTAVDVDTLIARITEALERVTITLSTQQEAP